MNKTILIQKSLKTKGFTLAEVLITLGVIGVVASLTIPTLVNNYQKQQYVTSLKKVYTEFNQALQKVSSDYGCSNDLKCTGLFDENSTSYSLGAALVKYFKTSKNCGVTTNQGCWSSSTNDNYDGKSATIRNYDHSGYYLWTSADGMSIAVLNYAANGAGFENCGKNWSQSGAGNLSQVCGNLFVDVNGPKPPNMYGRDTFWFFISNGKGALLYPRGGFDDKYSGANQWWKNPSTNLPKYCTSGNELGHHCAGRIMEEGWQMSY